MFVGSAGDLELKAQLWRGNVIKQDLVYISIFSMELLLQYLNNRKRLQQNGVRRQQNSQGFQIKINICNPY